MKKFLVTMLMSALTAGVLFVYHPGLERNVFAGPVKACTTTFIFGDISVQAIGGGTFIVAEVMARCGPGGAFLACESIPFYLTITDSVTGYTDSASGVWTPGYCDGVRTTAKCICIPLSNNMYYCTLNIPGYDYIIEQLTP